MMDTKEVGRSVKRQITAPRGKRPINVWVTPDERAKIAQHAEACGLPMSVYLRTLGLGHEPKSLLDTKNVRDLLHAVGDLGRLGGLLKLWLVERPGVGASVPNVRDVLNEIAELRAQVVEKGKRRLCTTVDV